MRNELPKGCRIDEYEIVRHLGRGGFGLTYLAFDHMLDGPVALKEYFPADIAVRTDGQRVVASTEQKVFDWGLDRFLKEARAIHRLRHPNLVRVHRYVERHGTAYIVMEYVEGESLASILESRGRLPVDEWRRWLDRLVNGLAHVHDHDYLHRDIKPANIVIRAADGEPVLIDFGAARVASQQRTHTQVLTDGYAPIEQYTSQGPQGPPTDIYALAAVSCRALTGEPPPSAPDRMLDDCCEPLAKRVVGASTGWLEAIDHGLALLARDRPQTIAAWRSALRRGEDKKLLSAPEVDKLDEACREGDEQALHVLLDEANMGNPDAMVTLACMIEDGAIDDYYDTSEDLHADCGTAVAWHQKAADSGHAHAQFEIGELCRKGMPAHAAAAWYRKAANQGHAGAQYQLGRLYDNDATDEPVDDHQMQAAEAALAWYRKAAAQGHLDAQYNLGRFYESGRGEHIPPDSGQTLAWFHKAASQGHVQAQFNLGHLYSGGDGSIEDDELAIAWFHKAASQGHAGAESSLGDMYLFGFGGSKDAARAAAWYRKAAQRDQSGVYGTSAQRALGEMYRAGTGVAKDANLAVAWYRRAAENGDWTARIALGEMYARGEGVPKNAEAAVAWYRRDNTLEQKVSVPLNVEPYVEFVRKRAENGDANAHFNLGWMYHHGKGVPEDAAEAAAWYRKAAGQGDARAQFNLGVMYTLREGVPRDLVEAHAWFKVASESNGQMTLFGDSLYEIARAALQAIEGELTAAEVDKATRRAQELGFLSRRSQAARRLRLPHAGRRAGVAPGE
ncbi:MAG: protein kinase [Acidobacteria bacterium]|nr:protein kinase [Acidobacteriota bacterium]